MTNDTALTLLYLLPALALVAIYVVRRYRHERTHVRALADAEAAGLTEPASLHPIIDPSRCIGSGGCARVCPEEAIGIIKGKAQLTNPALCIGHGACAAQCPVSAITLVFGSERRGVDIPQVDPNFETNVRGVFIVGELGGMGLIRKASEQGRQAMRTITSRPRSGLPLDVVIVGAGPAGIAAGLGAIEGRLKYVLIEQEPDLGGSVFHYPRNKIAMTAPVDLPLVGRMQFTEVGKEALLAFWKRIVDSTGLALSFGERLERLEPRQGGHRVVTSKTTYETGAVVMAIGRRGTPRKLDVAGEELPKVVYRLIDAEQYRGAHVLVVGGGDSAIEAALACAEQPDTTVTLAHRGDAFNRLKPANRERLERARGANAVDVLLRTQVRRIDAALVDLDVGGELRTIDNDAVIVQAGGVLPTELLKAAGVTVETKYGTA